MIAADDPAAIVVSFDQRVPMTTSFHNTLSGADPIEAILDAPNPGVLAIIAGVEGPSYRPLGAMMAIGADKTRVGTLSSGCIEEDIALHATLALNTNTPRLVRYGEGSPFVDIKLPCGGGLDILLLPNPDRRALKDIALRQSSRIGCCLDVDIKSGAMCVHDTGATARTGDRLTVQFDPALRFLVFGKGPEATSFAALVKSLGFSILLLSPDQETLQSGEAVGCRTFQMTTSDFPKDLDVDPHTAIVLFFHDHDWEPPLLKPALDTDAFYIGSQGSQRTRASRNEKLSQLGVSAAEISRLYGPVGLIPSARDPGTLAVSVLAEVLAKAMKNVHKPS